MQYLHDLWDEAQAAQFGQDPLELLRYRSNLLGADLRITNFGGGNTSSKMDLPDPLTGQPTRVMAVKGSGGDLGSIKRQGFAVLSMTSLHALPGRYPGEAREDEMVAYYPLCAFGSNTVAASIDTPLHAYLPYDHVDHLHPDWAIALAASANGKEKLAEFNARFKRNLVWLPWQRPGFELGLMLQEASQPGVDGILLGSHGLFTWGATQRECYLNSVTIIDELGQFVLEHQDRLGDRLFGGTRYDPSPKAHQLATAILPFLRGQVGTFRRSIAHFSSEPDVVEFINSHQAAALAELGTSCPDHFIRTRVKPLFIEWDPLDEDLASLQQAIREAAAQYRADYGRYYERFAESGSPALRDPNPSVVLIPGIGMFTFGKNKTEARITGEFYRNAIHVMAGATALAGPSAGPLPQAKGDQGDFASCQNYVALPPREAFRIEYWALEEAKLRRMPPEARFSRRILLVVGGGSGIGRATALQLASQGAHVMVADKNVEAARETAMLATKQASKEALAACEIDLESRDSIAAALRETAHRFGGVDGVVNTAAIFIAPDVNGVLPDEQWRLTFDINITGNYLLADEARKLMQAQSLPAVIVLTSSANAVVPKRGSEAYDLSKSAVNSLIRELAIGLSPLVRVNGIAPATVVQGSTMFPRERLIPSLTKYKIAFREGESTDELRTKLANFYAQRTLTHLPITPEDCAAAICWLASDESNKTSGHVIPVDGGLPEAFLR